eukprot:symbB.v1.2.023686.t2/scaffold2188.1/size86315/1
MWRCPTRCLTCNLGRLISRRHVASPRQARPVAQLKEELPRQLLLDMGHPWIYDNEIRNITELNGITAGTLVDISSADGREFGVGILNRSRCLLAGSQFMVQSKEKGQTAFHRDVRLGVNHVGHSSRSFSSSASNLVAEPMNDGRKCCQMCSQFWYLVCRSALITALCLGGVIALLDAMFLIPSDSIDSKYNIEPNHSGHGSDSRPVGRARKARPEWPNRFSAAFTVEFSGLTSGVVNMTLLGTDATILPTEDVLTYQQRVQVSRQAMNMVRSALDAHGGHMSLNDEARRLDWQWDESAGQTGIYDTDHNANRVLTSEALTPTLQYQPSSSNVVPEVTHRGLSAKGLNITVFLARMLLISSVVCSMQQNPFRPHNQQHGGPRGSGIGQSDAGPPFVGTATLKCPPSWSVERNHIYSLRSWVADLVLWSSATEIEGARQGPIAALQIQGSARELVRELTPQQLRDGDGQRPGLMLLVELLAQRYAPLDAENVTKSISDFLNFRRMPNESIDSVLVRFDILRNRAHQRAGFMINWTGLSWLLLQALQLNAETWDRLLAPLGGQMPADDAQLNDLMDRVRRLFHLREGRMHNNQQQGATGDPGAYFSEEYFPTFGGTEHHNIGTPRGSACAGMPPPMNSAYAAGGPHPPDPWSNSLSGAYGNQNAGHDAWNVAEHAFHAGHGDACPTCGVYFQDDGCSTDTSSDDGLDVGSVGSQDGAEVYQDYAFARKRWRKFSGRGPRRYRRNWSNGKGYRKSYASFLPPGAFAGGKGKSSGKGGGFGRKNPKDKNGQIMKCNKCGSDEHLWRRCPQNQQSGSDGARPSFPVNPGNTATGTSMALMTARPNWSSSVSGVLPGVHFLTGANSTLGIELENLRSVSQANSVASEVTPLVFGAAPPVHPPPAGSPWFGHNRKRERDDNATRQDDAIRRANAEGLQRLLVGMRRRDEGEPCPEPQRPRGMYPWWEVDEQQQPQTDGSGVFHLRTRRHDGSVGLLVDPGAHDNLSGSCTLDHNSKLKKSLMTNPLPVEGVGKKSQIANQSARVEMAVVDHNGEPVDASYCAPLIADSQLPPLLGNKTLRRLRTLLDLGDGRMIVPGPGGVELHLSPGSRVFALELTDSGHYVLPLTKRSSTKSDQDSHDRLDFMMGLRLERREDGVPGDVLADASPDPEVLSPDEAERRRADKAASSGEGGSGRRRAEAGVQVEAPRAILDRGDEAAGVVAIPDDRPDVAEAPSWSRYDLGFALQQLKSIREGVVRRMLRKLHIRWFHASSKRMMTLLEAAGVSKEVILLIPSIVDTCSVCRNWQRTGPKTVTSMRVPESFNQEVQIDLLFYKTFIILHAIDACIRWSAVAILPNRESSSILAGFCNSWLRIYGPPQHVLTDQEGGLVRDEVAEWFANKGIQLSFRAKSQHCTMVERHNDILRRQLHLIEDQTTSEGFAASFDMILSEAVFAKNALFQVGNSSPYQALFGRVPPLLSVMSEESEEPMTDTESARLRQIAISTMIQATAEMKAKIASQTKTRRAGELLELELNDMVDFYRKPITKDGHGWIGPAEVVNLTSMKDGMIHVKWQGRVIAVRIGDVRRSLLFPVFLTKPTGPVRVFKEEVESHIGLITRVGWIRQGSHWLPCQANGKFAEVLSAGLYVASVCMQLDGVIGFRFGTNVQSLTAVNFDDT